MVLTITAKARLSFLKLYIVLRELLEVNLDEVTTNLHSCLAGKA